MTAPMAKSTIVEDYLRSSAAVLKVMEATASANAKFRAELDAMQQSMADAKAKHDEELVAIRAAMPVEHHEEHRITAEVQQLRSDLTKLHAEHSRLAGEISKLQAEGSGSKDAIKSLNATLNRHTNELNSQSGQLDRMETKVSHLEVDKTYYKPTSLEQPSATDRRLQSSDLDGSELHARSPSMTLQGSPMWPNVSDRAAVRADHLAHIDAINSDVSSDGASSIDVLAAANDKDKPSPLESFKSGAMSGRTKQSAVAATSEPPLGNNTEGSQLSEIVADTIMEDPLGLLNPGLVASDTRATNNKHDVDLDMPPLDLPTQSLTSVTAGDKSNKVNSNKKGVAMKIVKETQASLNNHPELSPKDDNDILTSDIVVAARNKSGKRPFHTGYKSRSTLAPSQSSTAQAVPDEAVAPSKKIAPADQAEQASSTQSAKRQTIEPEEEDIAQPGAKRSKRKVKPRVREEMKSWGEVPAANLRR